MPGAGIAETATGWRTFPHIFRNAATARRRLREDTEAPRWARTSWPLVAAAQLAIMVSVRPTARITRRLTAAVRRPTLTQTALTPPSEAAQAPQPERLRAIG